MMRLIYLLMVLALFSGCKKEISVNAGVIASIDNKYIDAELKPLVTEYLNDMINRGVDVSGFNNVDSIYVVPFNTTICNDTSSIGCSFMGSVIVKKNYQYALFKEDYLRVIIYHELGHAVLNLPHINLEYNLMNPRIEANIYLYTDNWKYFVDNYVDYYLFCKKYFYTLQ